ncbi:MAG: hypothetical protein U9N33_10790 [Campylobacterota bacterium]|nr:hypothetical protein [Campylobacterota bacterium]
MKLFLQVFVFFSLNLNLLVAQEFVDVTTVTLKKDEQKKILVKYGDDVIKLFKFRWTLYQNGGLVVNRSYDKIVSQNILYLRFRNQSFRFNLMPKGAVYYSVPYMLVKFKEFNYETNEAVFELFLSDKTMQIKLHHLKNS